MSQYIEAMENQMTTDRIDADITSLTADLHSIGETLKTIDEQREALIKEKRRLLATMMPDLLDLVRELTGIHHIDLNDNTDITIHVLGKPDEDRAINALRDADILFTGPTENPHDHTITIPTDSGTLLVPLVNAVAKTRIEEKGGKFDPDSTVTKTMLMDVKRKLLGHRGIERVGEE
jgi:hypothetical protein